MHRITIDTNIYISAVSFPRGKPHQLLQMALEGEVRVAISDSIITEVLRIMRDKFHATPEDLSEIGAIIASCTERVIPKQSLNVVKDDPDDNCIVECAVEAGSEYIVTGDRDLLRMTEHAGIKIVTVSDFLQREMAG